MLKSLALQATLLRYGWRAALGQVLSSEKSTSSKVLRFAFFGYFPLYMLWTIFMAFEKLSNPERVAKNLQTWNFPSCQTASCQNLLQPSPLWPELLQVFWLGTFIALCGSFLGVIFSAAGTSATKLETTDRDLDWIKTFPIRIRSFLWGRVLQKTVFNFYLWVAILPFIMGFLLARGTNFLGILAPVFVMTLATTFMTTSLGMTLDYLVRSRFNMTEQRLIRSLMSLLAMLPPAFYVTLVLEGPGYWAFLMKHGSQLQDTWLFQSMQTFLMDPSAAYSIAALGVAICLMVASLNILIMEHLLRRDFAPEITPGTSGPKRFRSILDLLSPIARNQLLQILRDPSFLTRILVPPFFMAIGVCVNHYANNDPMGPEGYILFLLVIFTMVVGSSATLFVTRQKDALWLYGSTPRPLTDIFREQQRIFLALGVIVFLLPALFLLPAAEFQKPLFVFRFVLILVFLFLFESHNRNLAIACYHPDDRTTTVPFRQVFVMTPIFPLMSYCLSFGKTWFLTTHFILYIGLVFAYREKARLALVGLDDPMTKTKLPRGLADGLIAALIYSLVLNTAIDFFSLFRIDRTAEMPWPNLIISILFFVIFQIRNRSRQSTDLPVYGGRLTPENLLILMAGAALATIGTGMWYQYTKGWQGFELISHRWETATKSFSLLTIAAAWKVVLIEEYIFRGLIQRGLEQRRGFAVAWLLSAFLTTLCHKPEDFGSVLLVSLASGLLYHRTKILWPSLLLGAGVQLMRWLWL